MSDEIKMRLAQSLHGYFEHVPGKDFSVVERPQKYIDMAEDFIGAAARAGLCLVDVEEVTEEETA